MLSVVLLFGLIEIISGYNTAILQSSNSVNVSSVDVESSLANTYFPTITTSAVLNNTLLTNETTKGNNSVPSTRQLSASASFWTPIATHDTSMTTQLLSPAIGTSTPIRTETSGIVSETSRIVEETTTIQFSSITSSHSPDKNFQKTISLTPTTTATGKTTKTPGRTPCKEKVFWWDVKTGTLKFMLYGAFGVAIVCKVSLIVVCCRWRRQIKTVKKLQRQATMLSNPYVNNHVVGFPSPLQLDAFVITPESPYDTPEPVGTIQEDVDVSYVSVIDENESESHYAAVTANGTANYYADNESCDNDPLPSPAYTNASVFQMDPYQELMPANRTSEDHYTSLITRDENEENEEGEVTI